MQDLLSYMENTTDVFAAQAASPLVREIHKRVTEIKQNEDMQMNMQTMPCPFVKANENKENTMTEEKLYQNRDASTRNL